jgi:POT family proton-dependent oligopeptide transporter
MLLFSKENGLMLALFREQPRAFYMIFMVELWERFGFYTVQGILILYFIRFLGYSDVEAYYAFGAFTALLYGMVLLGGYLGDQVFGTKRTMVIGLITLIFGYLSLALVNQTYVFYALGLICVGNGLFKANPSNLLSKCYKKKDLRLHGGFTLYYMAINMGSSVALILGPTISSKYGYPYAYLLSAIGLVLALGNYWFQRHLVADINTVAEQRKVSFIYWIGFILSLLLLTFISAQLLQHVMITKWLLLAVTAVALIRYFLFMRSKSKLVCSRMFVAFILMVQAVVFFTLYQQMPSSLNLFAVHNVIPNILGLSFDPQSFQALNPLWIILMSPILAHMYRNFGLRKIDFSIAHKFAMGMTFCAISFLLLYFARFFYVEDGQVSSFWMIASYLFQSIGELLVSALGVAMVAELVPAEIVGFVMGLWFLASALAGYIGAFVASYTALPEKLSSGVESLMIYTHVFGCIGLVTLAISIVMWLFAPLLNRYIRCEA